MTTSAKTSTRNRSGSVSAQARVRTSLMARRSCCIARPRKLSASRFSPLKDFTTRMP